MLPIIADPATAATSGSMLDMTFTLADLVKVLPLLSAMIGILWWMLNKATKKMREEAASAREKTVSSLSSKFDSKMDEMEERVESLSRDRISKFEESLAGVKRTMHDQDNALTSRVAKMEGRIGTVEALIEEIRKNVDRLVTSVDSIPERVLFMLRPPPWGSPPMPPVSPPASPPPRSSQKDE